MFEFKFALDDNDYLLFNRYHLLNSPSGKKALTMYRLVVPIVFLAVILIFYIADAGPRLIIIEAILMAIVSALWLAFSDKLLLRSVNKNILKMKKTGRLPYSSEAVLKFGEENVHEITPNTENKTDYSLIEKIAVTEKAIYIYFSTVQAYILPITAFSDEAERRRFLEFIHSKVK
ncbi:MAG: YcxB family protein [Clostridiales bacterium]|jgi:hypothetical protein|nr:YcxB family protein [Clostridiales bacterium]OQA29735.1 MAG: hypothetical protein BWY59_00120 [Verrucomicrobia bacterium ADurb.Bin345]